MSKGNVVKKQHRSMRGKIVDIDLLRKKNELVPAIGNAKVNARGDELGPGGKIVKKREDIVKEYYEKNSKGVKDETGGFKTIKKEDLVLSEKISEIELTEEEKKLLSEDNDWEEDNEGNFVTKKTNRKR
jgi:hypothetical protein